MSSAGIWPVKYTLPRSLLLRLEVAVPPDVRLESNLGPVLLGAVRTDESVGSGKGCGRRDDVSPSGYHLFGAYLGMIVAAQRHH